MQPELFRVEAFVKGGVGMTERRAVLAVPREVTVEIAGEGGAPAARRKVRLHSVRQDARGPVLEGVCAETGQPESLAVGRIRALRDGSGSLGSAEDFAARLLAEADEGAVDPNWPWIDRMVMLAIAGVVAWGTFVIQGPKDILPYAKFWSFMLFLAGGLVGWVLLKSLLGLPRPRRKP